jgi:hypothetical protein
MASTLDSQIEDAWGAARSAGVELRITRRCRKAELGGAYKDLDLLELAQHHVVIRKFIELRGRAPAEGQETFRQAVSRTDIFTLHAGQMRGLTWYDREYRVVWLLGFATHRSGDHSDAYSVLAELDGRGRLLPDADDYEDLLREWDEREIPAMVARMRALRVQARAQPEKTHSIYVREGVRVSLYVVQASDSDGAIEEFHLAVSVRHLEDGWLDIIRTALCPKEPTAHWEYTKDFPDRGQSKEELRFKHLHALPQHGEEIS